VETFDQFAIVQRNFETGGDSMAIPFSCHDPGVQMIFSLDGESFFNKQSNPLWMSRSSHSINFFHHYNCANLLDARASQQDVAFRLTKGFYGDLIAQYLSCAEGGLPVLIAQEKEFNTINQHRQIDAAILGILRNILDCPFSGDMRRTYLREHIRALLTLQLFHFNHAVGKSAQPGSKITARDREILHEVKKFIEDNFLANASLDKLSKQFGINEFKLKHGFRILFETSPIRMLQQKRLAFALHLLRETDQTIKEISDKIGYAHASNFTTAFTKLLGHTPQYYRSGKDK
jgi:AraC-like DNA-binding protein